MSYDKLNISNRYNIDLITSQNVINFHKMCIKLILSYLLIKINSSLNRRKKYKIKMYLNNSTVDINLYLVITEAFSSKHSTRKKKRLSK